MKKNWSSIIKTLDYAFQPIVHTHNGKIYAVEALIRNVIGNDTFSSINDLFDCAFNDNYLYELDLQLRRKAFEKFSNIDIKNLKVFYNLDNRVIYNTNFTTNNTKKILDDLNLSKSHVCFELSEKGTFLEQNAISSAINKYKANGYQIAIDDFGIGVSGLKLLYFSEANIIKLDRFFITNIHEDKKKKLFCSSIIEMAHVMGIFVVAEGVETKEEFYTCKEIGADYIQGYLVQKPTINIKEIKTKYKVIQNLIENDFRKQNIKNIDDTYIEKIPSLTVNHSLYELFIHFREATDNHFVPITDEENNFLGVIYENDLKKISYSQYGLSLAQNLTYSTSLSKFIIPALHVELSWGIDKVLEIYNMHTKKEIGMFITKMDKYYGFISLDSLLTLSYNRNIEIATNQNPLTKLPGNTEIESFLAKAVKNKEENTYHIIYFDFDNFKPFNDLYGFRQGDRTILLFSELIKKKYSKDFLVGHIGGDDFFIGVKNYDFEKLYTLTKKVQRDFRDSVKNLYNNQDKENGYIISKDRFGSTRKFKLLSVSAAIIEINKHSDISNLDCTIGAIKKSSKSNKNPSYASVN